MLGHFLIITMSIFTFSHLWYIVLVFWIREIQPFSSLIQHISDIHSLYNQTGLWSITTLQRITLGNLPFIFTFPIYKTRRKICHTIFVRYYEIIIIAAAAAAKSLQSCPTLCDPRGLQPTRLLHLRDSPGKNTGMGCLFLLQCMKVESESEVAQSCPTLSDPMDCSLPGSSIHGILWATVLEQGAIAFSLD